MDLSIPIGSLVLRNPVIAASGCFGYGVEYADTGAGAYPALLVTYEIVCSKGLPADKTAIVKDFLTYFSSSDEQSKLEELGYAPLPSELQSKVQTTVAAIQ